jgi:hypothetical protein
MWTGIIILLVYGATIVWWGWEYARPGWQGVTTRQMRYYGLGKTKAHEADIPQEVEGDEAFWKGAFFLGVFVAMIASWLFLLVGMVWSLLEPRG